MSYNRPDEYHRLSVRLHTELSVYWNQGTQTGGDEPDTPDTPDTPEGPDTPDTPEGPDIPDTPEGPDTPDTPEGPVLCRFRS